MRATTKVRALPEESSGSRAMVDCCGVQLGRRLFGPPELDTIPMRATVDEV